MKKYDVGVDFGFYIIFDIEANSKEEAMEKIKKEVEKYMEENIMDYYYLDDISYGTPIEVKE
jgi:phosphoribosylformylglycinamidine (FGAM) synthase PurS component